MAHFEHGALNADGRLIDPFVALRRTPYTCPDCNRAVHVKKGERRSAHFAHNPDTTNPCTYYDRKPSLDQRHRNAQLKLKQFLEQGKEIDIARACPCGCRWISHFGLYNFKDRIAKCEYRFRFNNSDKRADVAVLDSDGNIICIFEVVHTHYTGELERPEPWHEIRADEINAIPSSAETIALVCIRQTIRPECRARHAAERNAAEERRKQREQERREEEAREEERDRLWRERQEKRFREKTELWHRRERERLEDVRGNPELDRLEAEAHQQRRREAQEKWDREEGQRLLNLQRQRDERQLQLQQVEDDHKHWEGGDPRRTALYRKWASSVPTCMLCASSVDRAYPTSLGRCKGCNADIRKRVDNQLR